MKWVLSVLRALRVVFMLFLLGLTILLYVILETSYGVKLVNTFLPIFLPFTLEIDSPRGALLDNLYANKVVYRDDVVEVTVKNPSLRLDAIHLLWGEIKIDNVKADDVSVIILEDGEPSTLTRAKLLENLTLPFSLKVTNSHLKHLLVGEAHQKPWVDLQQANVSALMNGEPHFTLIANWTEGELNFIPDVSLHSIQGQFNIDGRLPNYKVNFDSELLFDQKKNIHVELAGLGNFSGLNLNTVNLRLEKSAVSMPMQLTWLPHFQWNIPKFVGKIHNYPITGHVALRNDGSHWQVDDSIVQVHDASLKITGKYSSHSIDPQQAQFDFELAIPHMETLITGSKGHFFVNSTWSGTSANPSIDATLNAGGIVINKNVSLQRLQGHLQAKSVYPLSADSYWSQFNFNTTLQANQVHIGNEKVDSANLRFTGALDLNRAAALHVEANNVAANNAFVKNLVLDVNNKNGTQKATIQFNWKKKKLAAVVEGQYQDQSWQGTLENLQTNFDLRLQKKNALLINANRIKIDTTCFNLSRSFLCGDVDWQKDKSLKATLNGKNIPIQTISQFFLPNQKLDGTFSLNANIFGDGHIIQTGNLNLVLSNGQVIDDSGDTPTRIPFRASHVDINLSEKGLVANSDLNILDQPPIRWQILAPKLKLSDPNWADTPINGYLQFSTRQLAPIANLYPQLKNIKGLLTADVKINGTLKEPKLLGGIQFKEGQLDVPSLGLHLTPIDLSIMAQDNKITYNGRITTNPGILTLQGYSDLNPANPKTELQINGNAITVMHTSEYQVSASPELRLTWLNQLLDVEGQITIPKAQLSPIDLGDTVTLSNDVVFVNGKEKKQKTHLPIRTHVKIILGDKIFLNVKGLTARLAGAVDVQENENNSQTTAVGQINLINGRYKAHGQNLDIRTGRATFTGGVVTNPGIYAEVVRTVSVYAMANNLGTGQNGQQAYGALQSDVIVGARITGTADVPQVTFFSEPAIGLTQSQILSYLVLGKGSSSGSELDTTLLLKAVSFLDIGGQETAATKNSLQKDLGLDEISVQSGQEYSTESQSLVNNTSLVLGKALSPKLFVDYSIGLIEPINILRIRYQLSKHFVLRSESNVNAQGIDIFYNIER